MLGPVRHRKWLQTVHSLAGPENRPADVVVFGAPGATSRDGMIQISAAGRERATLAARFWLSFDQTTQPMRMICVAGRPKYRSGMPPLAPDQSEAAEMVRIMRELGVPQERIWPGESFSIGRDYATSTVDEVALLVEKGFIAPAMYKPSSPLAIVAHRRHGARVLDVLRKVGFDARQTTLVTPETLDSISEIAIRGIYRMLVLRGWRHVPAHVLRDREDRLMTAFGRAVPL